LRTPFSFALNEWMDDAFVATKDVTTCLRLADLGIA
jgi:hypothetical protein